MPTPRPRRRIQKKRTAGKSTAADIKRGNRAIKQSGGRTGEAYIGTGGATDADRKRGDRAIKQGGGRTGAAYVGTGKSSPKPTSKPTPKKSTLKAKPKPKGSAMEQWARANPKLAARVKPGQVGYAAAQKVLREMKAKKTNVSAKNA